VLPRVFTAVVSLTFVAACVAVVVVVVEVLGFLDRVVGASCVSYPTNVPRSEVSCPLQTAANSLWKLAQLPGAVKGE
jgi:hypothetical protein